MKYFRFIYMLSGRYKSIYKAKILLWQDGIIKVRDEDGREHILKEEFIKSIAELKDKKEILKIDSEDDTVIEQQELF